MVCLVCALCPVYTLCGSGKLASWALQVAVECAMIVVWCRAVALPRLVENAASRERRAPGRDGAKRGGRKSMCRHIADSSGRWSRACRESLGRGILAERVDSNWQCLLIGLYSAMSGVNRVAALGGILGDTFRGYAGDIKWM